MSVYIDRRILEGFKRRAAKHFPKEHIESLWGTVGKSYFVYAICPLHKYKATRNGVEYEPVAEEEQGGKIVCLGSIHTHPNCWAAPSETDWREFNEIGDEHAPERIMGIMGIRQKGERKFYSFGFYEPEGQLELIVGE